MRIVDINSNKLFQVLRSLRPSNRLTKESRRPVLLFSFIMGVLVSFAGVAMTEAHAQASREFDSCKAVRDFYNSLPGLPTLPSTPHNLGCVNSDPASRAEICRRAGFQRVVSFQTGRWRSCGDNTAAVFNATSEQWSVIGACAAGNTNLDLLVCDTPFAECSDGRDNDGDGLIDALVELPELNGETYQLGGAGNPSLVRTTVRDAIASKGFNITLPNRDSIVRSDGGNWVINGCDQGIGVTEDLQTLQAVCRIMGYRDYVSSTCRDAERSGRYPHGKCNFHSPSDNNN